MFGLFRHVPVLLQRVGGRASVARYHECAYLMSRKAMMDAYKESVSLDVKAVTEYHKLLNNNNNNNNNNSNSSSNSSSTLMEETIAACEIIVDRCCVRKDSKERPKGRLFVTGVGKSFIVGERIAAACASVSVCAVAVHAVEFLHGSLAAVTAADVLLLLSHSGTTAELLQLLHALKGRNLCEGGIIAVLGHTATATAAATTPTTTATSATIAVPLAVMADAIIDVNVGEFEELLGCIPSRSVVLQECVGNAIVSVIVNHKHFKYENFVHTHPAGAIGATIK